MSWNSKKNLYIDVDGVLLGKNDPNDADIVLANGAQEFLEYCIARFHCFWLSSHCRDGDSKNLLKYLGRYTGDSVKPFLTAIKPIIWNVFKTEGIDLKSDFFWIDDQLLSSEIEVLKKNNCFDRWIQVDTRKEPNDLKRALSFLKAKEKA